MTLYYIETVILKRNIEDKMIKQSKLLIRTTSLRLNQVNLQLIKL